MIILIIFKKNMIIQKIILKCLLDLIIICRRSKNKAKIKFVSYISLQQSKSSSVCLSETKPKNPSQLWFDFFHASFFFPSQKNEYEAKSVSE